MAVVDVVVVTYKGILPEAYSALVAMLQATNCACRNPRTGGPAHEPWKCTSGKHSVRFMPPLFGSSVVHWARNQAVAQAMYGQPEDGRPASDYLCFMDDDMVVEPDYLVRLLSYRLDIVCGICTVRRDPPRPNIRFWCPEKAQFFDPVEWDWDSQKLIEIDTAGAAFMLVKRSVLARMAKAYLDCEFERAEDERKEVDASAYWDRKADLRQRNFAQAIEEKDWKRADCWWFQFLDNVADNQIGELGEDLAFCWKAKRLGFRVYADPQVLPGHLGMYSYSVRDYREFIEDRKRSGEMPPLQENRTAIGVAPGNGAGVATRRDKTVM